MAAALAALFTKSPTIFSSPQATPAGNKTPSARFLKTPSTATGNPLTLDSNSFTLAHARVLTVAVFHLNSYYSPNPARKRRDWKQLEQRLNYVLVDGYPLVSEAGLTSANIMGAARKALDQGILETAEELILVIECAAWYAEQCIREKRRAPNSWAAYVGSAIVKGYHATPDGFVPWSVRVARARTEALERQRQMLQEEKHRQEAIKRELRDEHYTRWLNQTPEEELRSLAKAKNPVVMEMHLPLSSPWLTRFFGKCSTSSSEKRSEREPARGSEQVKRRHRVSRRAGGRRVPKLIVPATTVTTRTNPGHSGRKNPIDRIPSGQSKNRTKVFIKVSSVIRQTSFPR